MPLTITYDQWIKDTYSRFDQRSDDLKKIDDAIKMRNEAAAKAALIKWIDGQNAKHQDWHRSVRNEKGAVERLYKELGVLGSAAPASLANRLADSEAKTILWNEHRLAAARMFIGKEILFKKRFLVICQTRCTEADSRIKQKLTTVKHAETVTGVVGALNTVHGLASDLHTIIKTIMGEGLSEGANEEIVKIIFGTSIEQFVHNAAPFFGMISSGAKTLIAWKGVAVNIYDRYKMEERYGDVRPGNAAAALQAMVAVIDREIIKQSADGVIRTAAFSGKLAGAVADFGTATTAAIGAIESVAIILNTLVDVVKDARQKAAGNKLIAAGKIDIELFNVCPILGCYYIAVQDHSTIMNFEIDNMGRENWRQEAERLRYALEPVIKKAAELISRSRLEIPDMDGAKGVYQTGLLQKINLYRKSKGYGQNKNMTSMGPEMFDIFEPS